MSEHSGRKLGDTALVGYLRQGLAELRAAAPLAESNIAQPTNYAMPGVATPGEVTEARREETPDQEESFLAKRIGRDGPDAPGRDDPHRGIDR